MHAWICEDGKGKTKATAWSLEPSVTRRRATCQVPDREGTELKTLTVEPAPPGQQGRRDTAFRLRHKSAGGTAEVFIYVTPGEMKVLESIAQQALPMLAGFEVWPDGGNFDMSGGGGAGAGGGGQDMSLMG